jgi:hypothetical protein
MRNKLEELKYFKYLMFGVVAFGSAVTIKDNIKEIKEIVSRPEFKSFVQPYKSCINSLKKDKG